MNLCEVFESIVRDIGLMGEHLEVHKLGLTEGTQHVLSVLSKLLECLVASLFGVKILGRCPP